MCPLAGGELELELVLESCTRARARSFSLAARAARRTFSQRSSSSLSFVTRTSCTGCVSPTSRRAIAIAELLSCSTLTSARAGEHSAVCGVSARCSQKRTAPRGSKPACASSLVVVGWGRWALGS